MKVVLVIIAIIVLAGCVTTMQPAGEAIIVYPPLQRIDYLGD